MAVVGDWVVSAVILLSALRVVKVQRHRGLIDGYDSGDALRADAAGRYLQLNLASAQQSRRNRNR